MMNKVVKRTFTSVMSVAMLAGILGSMTPVLAHDWDDDDYRDWQKKAYKQNRKAWKAQQRWIRRNRPGYYYNQYSQVAPIYTPYSGSYYYAPRRSLTGKILDSIF